MGVYICVCIWIVNIVKLFGKEETEVEQVSF